MSVSISIPCCFQLGKTALRPGRDIKTTMDEGILYKKTDDIENLSLFGYDVSYTYLNENWAPHYHRALELIYILEGTATVFMNKQKYVLKPKDILVIDSMRLHELVYRKRKATGVLVEISKSYMKKFLPEIEQLDIEFCSQQKEGKEAETARLQQIMEEISLAYRDHARGFMLKSASLMLELLSILTECFSISSYEVIPGHFISRMEHLGDTIAYIEENYRRSISLQEAADHVGFSKEYFCRYFKKNSGYSFMDFLSNVRLNHIYQDLLFTADPVNEIIDRNGYANTKLFYEKFKKKYGLTPGQVRRLHTADQQQN